MIGWRSQVYLTELRNLITYRADFWVNFFGQTFFSLIIAYYLWNSIFSYAGQDVIQGYSIQSMIFYYLTVPLIFRIQQGQGIGFLSREIYDGTLNKYILYPLEVYHYKLTTYLAHASFYLVQLLLIISVYNFFYYDPLIYTFSVINTLAFLMAMIVSSITFFYLFTLCEVLAFWFDNICSLGVILRFGTSFFGGALIPLSFFPEDMRYILSFTPFPYLIDFPMKSLLGTTTVSTYFITLSISITWLFFFRYLSITLWNKGQLKYTGVGI